MPSTRRPEGEKPAPPFKHPGKMQEKEDAGGKRSADDTDSDLDMVEPERDERRTDSKPMGEAGTSKSTEPRQGGDAARKAQEWGGGSKGAKGSVKH